MTGLLRPAGAGELPKTTTILGLGGTLRPGSSSEQALRHALAATAGPGVVTQIITARELNFPMYEPEAGVACPAVARLLAAVRAATGLIVATPGYHGGLSGLLKNALDHLQELADDPMPYLHGKAVGCIVTAAGWQAGVTTLSSLRSTVHALRGWPTPLGVVINSSARPFAPNGAVTDAKVADQLATLGAQVTGFAKGQL